MYLLLLVSLHSPWRYIMIGFSLFLIALPSPSPHCARRGCALLAGLQSGSTALHVAAENDKTGAVLKPLLGALEGAGILKEGLEAKANVRETAPPSTFFVVLMIVFVYFIAICDLFFRKLVPGFGFLY